MQIRRLIMNETAVTQKALSELKLPLERDVFLRTLIRELAGTLEEVVGLKEASGFVSVVGQTMGTWINNNYKELLDQRHLDRAQVVQALVDLKDRIKGDFYVLEHDDEKVVFGNRACPFEDKVVGRNSMCMMTSNVFGSIAADNLGYAKVQLQETIARGDAGCRVVVYFKRTDEARAAEGREYFGSEASE
jgi:predicted ArsR family transcriptional regulator